MQRRKQWVTGLLAIVACASPAGPGGSALDGDHALLAVDGRSIIVAPSACCTSLVIAGRLSIAESNLVIRREVISEVDGDSLATVEVMEAFQLQPADSGHYKLTPLDRPPGTFASDSLAVLPDVIELRQWRIGPNGDRRRSVRAYSRH